jgi:hypothetical protein
VVIHEPYHFEIPDTDLSLTSLVKKHQKTSPDSDKGVIHDRNPKTRNVLPQPDIGQTPEKEEAKASKHTPQGSSPTRNCTVSNHGGYSATFRCY